MSKLSVMVGKKDICTRNSRSGRSRREYRSQSGTLYLEHASSNSKLQVGGNTENQTLYQGGSVLIVLHRTFQCENRTSLHSCDANSDKATEEKGALRALSSSSPLSHATAS